MLGTVSLERDRQLGVILKMCEYYCVLIKNVGERTDNWGFKMMSFSEMMMFAEINRTTN